MALSREVYLFPKKGRPTKLPRRFRSRPRQALDASTAQQRRQGASALRSFLAEAAPSAVAASVSFGASGPSQAAMESK